MLPVTEFGGGLLRRAAIQDGLDPRIIGADSGDICLQGTAHPDDFHFRIDRSRREQALFQGFQLGFVISGKALAVGLFHFGDVGNDVDGELRELGVDGRKNS